ncbi:MAG: beta-ketoacyl-ACP synthase II, partial [Anaerolineae bacterium]|nr:beta-ketoacyl-ACP synthase II [Anaerolineae bacterium]
MKRRVVITGLGAVTPMGNDVPTVWDNLLAGRSGVDHITRFDTTDLKVKIAAEVKNFDAEGIFGRREARRNDPVTLFAMEAARQAVEDANLVIEGETKQRAGAIVGTGIGGVLSLLQNYDVINTAGPNRVSPFMIPMMMSNAPSAAVSITHGLQGPVFSIASACATGNNALGEATYIIRRGDADVMFCGGTEMVMHAVAISGFANMGAISSRNDEPHRASRPFDAERDGFVMGEGGAVLILESLDFALKRGARIYGELVGYGTTCDACHITAPDENGTGAARAMSLALQDAGLKPEDVDYVNAHGTSTQLNDPMETRAIRSVFGAHADKLAISSTKSMMGHLMGAAGACEAIVCAKTLETGWVHPTINYEHPDPECDLYYVPNESKRLDPKVIISNSFGFGGHNACVIFRKWE